MKKMLLSLMLAFSLAMPAAASEAQLHAVGSLAAGNLYLMYLSIGTVADAYVKGVYDKDKTRNILRSLTGQAGVQKNSLEALKQDPEVAGSDLAVLDKMIQCLTVLVDQAGYLQKYIDSGEIRNLELYDQKRAQAWQLIESMFGQKPAE